ncbi:hypothetical protein [uncultured Phenylobacterium sp.]|uniref:hypothetical protein n=1 Tax=uncultured Phenylobacterium sp. TaxID=349273 RepID=UPI0025CB9DBA|nr:hypothetical protein [uncultured Phenylobacterium sp.]
MPTLDPGRPGFLEWLQRQNQPLGWGLMPLTHITKGVTAEDIIRADKIETQPCNVFDQSLAYLFYGRPAYRISEEGSVKFEAACPYCFIFRPNLIKHSRAIFAFDTGAYSKRMYAHHVTDEMRLEDFNLGSDQWAPNHLIHATFGSMDPYLKGDTRQIPAPDQISEDWDFHARAYLNLVTSPGRNEPDDRVCSVEVIFDKDVPLVGDLQAIVVPHTLWTDQRRAPWLEKLNNRSVIIKTYEFIPGRNPEHYHTLLETEVRDLYRSWSMI